MNSPTDTGVIVISGCTVAFGPDSKLSDFVKLQSLTIFSDLSRPRSCCLVEITSSELSSLGEHSSNPDLLGKNLLPMLYCGLAWPSQPPFV